MGEGSNASWEYLRMSREKFLLGQVCLFRYDTEKIFRVCMRRKLRYKNFMMFRTQFCGRLDLKKIEQSLSKKIATFISLFPRWGNLGRRKALKLYPVTFARTFFYKEICKSHKKVFNKSGSS